MVIKWRTLSESDINTLDTGSSSTRAGPSIHPYQTVYSTGTSTIQVQVMQMGTEVRSFRRGRFTNSVLQCKCHPSAVTNHHLTNHTNSEHSNTETLISIIPSGSPILQTIIHQSIHIVRTCTIIKFQSKSFSQASDRVVRSASKAIQIFIPNRQHFNQQCYFKTVFSQT